MATIIGLASGIPVILIIVALHCACASKREKVFPVEELEKFNKQ